jgi:multidrug efflux pump subunit AcrB
MDITKYAIKNYQFTLIMVLMVMAVGISTMLTMPRSEDPDMKSPHFPVVVIYPGTSPKDMEELVVKPLERRIYALDNMKQIKTSVLDGLAILNVEYRYNSDVDEKYQELVREVDAVRQQLPQDIYSIDVQKVEPSGVNVLQAALISENAPRARLKKAAEDLQDELEKITSLKDVTISGLPEQLIRVDVQPDRIKQLHIPLTAVMQAIQGEAANVPAGSVIAGGKSFNIKTSGNYQSMEQIKRTIVAGSEGKSILLQDIAQVYPDYAPDTHITRLNGHRCLFVTAAQKSGENISDTQDQYLPVIDKFKKTLPSNIDLVLNFDQAENVSRRLNGLGEDFLIAVLLVLITLLPLGPRASLVVMIAIPLSLSIGIVLVHILGYSLNQLSIVGFVVALGLLVDDSIVVVENTERWMR